MKRIFPIILLSCLLFACHPEEKAPSLFDTSVEVVCVYTPRGIGDNFSAELIYKAVLRTTDSLNIAYRSIYLYLREGMDGFIDGFTKERNHTIDIYDISMFGGYGCTALYREEWSSR